MKINNTSIHQPSFKAHIVNNQALRILVKDVRAIYGDEYLRTVAKKVKEIGTDNDEIKFTYSTWTYQKGLGMKQRKEGVTFVLLNDKYVGHFENRFLSNFLSQTKTYIKEHGNTLKKQSIEQATPAPIIKKTKKENKIIKTLKKLISQFIDNYY